MVGLVTCALLVTASCTAFNISLAFISFSKILT